jgi:Short repeat of unknown function (DUF308)
VGDRRRVVEFFAAFASGEPAGTRAMFILGGLVTIAFGVVLCVRPGIGAVTLALLFGLFNLIAGIWMLAQGMRDRPLPGINGAPRRSTGDGDADRAVSGTLNIEIKNQY